MYRRIVPRSGTCLTFSISIAMGTETRTNRYLTETRNWRCAGAIPAGALTFRASLEVGDRKSGLGGGLAEHAAEGVLGFFEALVGFGVALLGVFEVVAEFFEDVDEGFHLLFHAVEAAKNAAGVFLDLHAAHAHGDDAEIRVKRVGRNGHDFFVAAIGIDGLAFGVEGVEHF